MKREKAELFNRESAEYQAMEAHLKSGKALLGEESPFSALLQRMVNGILEGEMEAHLFEERDKGNENKRNGYQKPRKVMSNTGSLQINMPRDRRGSFESEIIDKRSRALNSGMDEQILAMYAQGNSHEDIRRLLQKMFGVQISSGKISMITDKILPEIEEWNNRRLQSFYAVVYLDAIHYKVRHQGKYEQRASYTAYAIDAEGNRDILGIYIKANEGASRWASVVDDIKKRGTEDVMVFCTDDLTGLSQVMTEAYPAAVVQKCIVHAVRASLKRADDKDRKALARDLKTIYTAPNRETAMISLETCRVKWKEEWGNKYMYICDKWENQWDELVAFMDFPAGLRRMIYTTNPVEAVHRIVRKFTKGKAAWSSDTALLKQLYLSLMYNKKSWQRKAYGWKEIQRDIALLYPERAEKYFD